ncbi:hypothetical protein T01_13371 [Trichinella spiralis]|uniref:FERM domain-containing protein n=1 Tax=Trichinella spiralis TaxID=6334 RepID=A0A0V1BB29_TRISP|nr:hypothetical protein T01_13371 [Trichinella spiralis]
MRQGKICKVTIYSGFMKMEMPIKSSTTGKELLAAALAKLHLPKYDIFVLVDKQRRPLKMNVAVRKQVTRNDPTLKMITLYHSAELDEPLMLNDAFVAIQYVEAIENLICGKIILSYENLIQLIAIAIHQNFLAPRGSEWRNIPSIHWLRKRFRVSRKKWMSDINEKLREHSFNNNIQAMKCFLIHAKNASTFSNQLLFTSNNYALIGMNRKGIHFYIDNNCEAYINWSQLISVKQNKRKVTVKYVEKQKLTAKIMFRSRGDAKSFVKFCKMLQNVEHLDATLYSFNPMNDWLESSSAESDLWSKCNNLFKDVNSLNDEKSFFNEKNCGSDKKARTMKKTHTDFEERQEENKTKEHLRIIREIIYLQNYLLRRIALLRASFNRQKHFVSLNTAYQTYKNQFNEFKTNVMPHYTKKMSKGGPFFIRRSLTAMKPNCGTELFYLKMNSTPSSR